MFTFSGLVTQGVHVDEGIDSNGSDAAGKGDEHQKHVTQVLDPPLPVHHTIDREAKDEESQPPSTASQEY